jgi:hypothetical protein
MITRLLECFKVIDNQMISRVIIDVFLITR